MTEEIWKTIADHDGYEISNLGRVKSIKRIGRTADKILRQKFDKSGYVFHGLSSNSKLTWAKAHRLVAQAFIPNPDNKPFINHINGIKHDNRVENLEWCTRSENAKHAFSIGLQSNVGVKNPKAILSPSDVINIRNSYRRYYNGCPAIAKQYGVSASAIFHIIRNRSWTIV